MFRCSCVSLFNHGYLSFDRCAKVVAVKLMLVKGSYWKSMSLHKLSHTTHRLSLAELFADMSAFR